MKNSSLLLKDKEYEEKRLKLKDWKEITLFKKSILKIINFFLRTNTPSIKNNRIGLDGRPIRSIG